MFADVAVNAERAPGAASAKAAVARLGELSADLRGCAVLDDDGRALASTGSPERWGRAGAALLAAADAADEALAAQVHVATEDGEAFALRHEKLAMVAVAERFTLASLMLFDMHTVLRDLAGEPAGSGGGQGAADPPETAVGRELLDAAANLVAAAG
jgi:hypothetical protein